jgi:hypothetical protein
MQRWFLGLMTVRDQAADQITYEIVYAAVPGMLNLGDVLQLVQHRFDDGAFPQQQFVSEWQQSILHIGSEFGNQLQAESLSQLSK